jgi:hypothetical protein
MSGESTPRVASARPAGNSPWELRRPQRAVRLIVFALLTATTLIQAPADSLHGMVRAAGTSEGIPGVRVSVRGHAEFALTDTAGHYVLHHLPEDRLELLFERLGFQPLTVDVTAGRGGGVDVDLAPAAIALAPLAVVPLYGAPPPASEDEIGSVRLTKATTRRDPLVGDDDVLAGLSAGRFASGREQLAPLRVRGGSGDENLVLLDGLPWRGPRPPGGVVGMLPSTAVASVDVHTTVPPARYGDALSSIIVLQPEIGGQPSAEGTVDPTAVEQAVGAPLGQHGASLFVSGRHSYRTLWGQADETGESRNGFGDVFAHLFAPAAGGALDVYYLGSRHELAFPARVELAEADSATASDQNQFSANGALGGIVWTNALGEDRRAQARAWYSEVDGQSTWGPLAAASNLQELGAGADYTSPRTEAGFSVSRIATVYHVRQSPKDILTMNAAPIIAAVFAAQRWTPARAWTISTGLRLSATPTWGLSVEPRVWTRVALGPRGTTSISLGFARVHQYVQSARNPESVVDALIGVGFPIAAGSGGVPPARSDQLSGEIRTRLGSRATVQLDVYRRWLSGLALTPLATGRPFADAVIPAGRGRVWGGDAILTYAAERFDLHLHAGLLTSYRTAGTMRYRTGDARARVAVGLGYRLPRGMVMRFALRAGAGHPTTVLQNGMQLESSALLGTGELAGSPETAAGPPNCGRLSNYVRADFGFGKSWGMSRTGSPRITTAVTVANVFNRHNVLASVAAPAGARPVFLPSRTLTLRVRWYLAR